MSGVRMSSLLPQADSRTSPSPERGNTTAFATVLEQVATPPAMLPAARCAGPAPTQTHAAPALATGRVTRHVQVGPAAVPADTREEAAVPDAAQPASAPQDLGLAALTQAVLLGGALPQPEPATTAVPSVLAPATASASTPIESAARPAPAVIAGQTLPTTPVAAPLGAAGRPAAPDGTDASGRPAAPAGADADGRKEVAAPATPIATSGALAPTRPAGAASDQAVSIAADAAIPDGDVAITAAATMDQALSRFPAAAPPSSVTPRPPAPVRAPAPRPQPAARQAASTDATSSDDIPMSDSGLAREQPRVSVASSSSAPATVAAVAPKDPRPAAATGPGQQVLAALQAMGLGAAKAEPTGAHSQAAAIDASAPAVAEPAVATPAGLRTMTIKLNPENLGTVSIKLRLVAGTLDVRIEVANGQALDLLDRDRHVLSAAIEASGGKPDSLVLASLAQVGSGSGVAIALTTPDAPQPQARDAAASFGERSQQQGARPPIPVSPTGTPHDDSATTSPPTRRALDSSLYL